MDYGNLTRSGSWVKAADLKEGSKAKILDEVTRVESQFRDEKTGELKKQDVGKVQFHGMTEAMNVNFNRATIRGLVEAFGADSKSWVGKILTVHTEKTTVAGKRVTALYFVADGFVVGEDEEGYVTIRRTGETGNALPSDDTSDSEPF